MIFLDITIDKLLADIDELLSLPVNFTPTKTVVYAILTIIVLLSTLAFILFIVQIIRHILKKPTKKVEVQAVPEVNNTSQRQAEIEIGDFGEVVDVTHIKVKGETLSYFILKKNKYEEETLPVGTVVVILKRSDKEAYVKEADANDLKKKKK